MNIRLFGLLMICSATIQSYSSPVPDEQVTTAESIQDVISFAKMPVVLPGTKPLAMEGDLSLQMMDGAHKYVERKIEESKQNRAKVWNRNFSSAESYNLSVETNRKRFMRYIGVEDKGEPFTNYRVALSDKNPPALLQRITDNNDPELVAETPKYKVYQVRWTVLNGVYAEGLQLIPKTEPAGNVIAIPDAGQTPEQLIGLSPGIPVESQFARRLAENGFHVLIPVLINRTLINKGRPEQMTYRERIYRQAYHMGRHIIGYEVQKVLAAIDWLKKSAYKDLNTGVAGYCEGGLIAFYSAAVDRRIDAVLVSGYFNDRQKVWDEPLYRNIWALLTEFGDAEVSSLIAPRPLIVEYSKIPHIIDAVEEFWQKPVEFQGFPFTGYKGKIETPGFENVQLEFNRIEALLKKGFQKRFLISGNRNEPLNFGSEKAIGIFSEMLGSDSDVPLSDIIPVDERLSFNPDERQLRQVKEIEDHVQWLLRISDLERYNFFRNKVIPEYLLRSWSTKPYHPYYSPDNFIEQSKDYRKYFYEEIIGKFDEEILPQNVRTRKIYEKERWTGYEVVMDVYQDLYAWGIILIPKDIRAGEKRPVVVCQHGRNGVPKTLIEANSTGYNDVAARLAERGFVVYVPHNLYRGEDRYRWLCKKANSVKATLFSFIIAQHDQALRWLEDLPFADGSRIAFYGLSYGGESAMRIPAVLEKYCLSICSGDFGDWTRKVADVYGNSFVNTVEWEMPYFNMGQTFSYAEMTYLIFPRPFMVERGHDDLVQPDEWVLYEYGKVKYLYDHYGLGDKTEIDIFNGGHSMRFYGTFAFLNKHLNWP